MYSAYENTGVNRYAFCVSMNKISYTLYFITHWEILCRIQNTGHKIFNIIYRVPKITVVEYNIMVTIGFVNCCCFYDNKRHILLKSNIFIK